MYNNYKKFLTMALAVRQKMCFKKKMAGVTLKYSVFQ